MAVLTDPLTVRLFNEMPDPLIVLPVPLITSVEPAPWLNEPEPVVARLPVSEIVFEEKTTPEAETVRLLKFCTPVPFTTVLAPARMIVLVLPVNVPLFTQLPPMVWV